VEGSELQTNEKRERSTFPLPLCPGEKKQKFGEACARDVQSTFILQQERTHLFFLQRKQGFQASLVFQLSSSEDVFQLQVFFKNFLKNYFQKSFKTTTTTKTNISMAFPKGANLSKHYQAYLQAKEDSSSSSSDEDLASKVVLLAKETQGKNKKVVRYDRQIAELEARQRKLMVDLHDLQQQINTAKQERKKVVKRLKEDSFDSMAKFSAKLGLAIKMSSREALEPPKKKKRAAVIEELDSSSTDSASEAEEDNVTN
jgi:hypothetical protein